MVIQTGIEKEKRQENLIIYMVGWGVCTVLVLMESFLVFSVFMSEYIDIQTFFFPTLLHTLVKDITMWRRESENISLN